eukprot:4073777-Amphidinium_carterae.1
MAPLGTNTTRQRRFGQISVSAPLSSTLLLEARRLRGQRLRWIPLGTAINRAVVGTEALHAQLHARR